MASFEYQSLKKHLESRGRFLGGIVNHILRTAQDNAEDGEIGIAAEDVPYEYDFLEDRWLIAEMLAERPEIAFAEAHNTGFCLRLREQAQELKALTQAELDAISERHCDYLRNLPGGECADLSGTVLLGLDLHGKDLSTANFSGAVLRECDMEGGSFDDCDFSGAGFYAVQAGGASFEQSNFTGARFENCNFWAADFECGDFTGAVFEGTNLHNTTLDGCTFYGAQLNNTDLSTASTDLAKGLPDSKAQALVEVAQARHTLWRHGQPDGQQANFSSQTLTKLDFSGKQFDGALFCNAEISRCDMRSGDFFACDFNGAAIEGCDFTGASCQDADFTGAQLHGCDFRQAELCGADFSQAEIHNCTGLDDVLQGPMMTMGGGIT